MENKDSQHQIEEVTWIILRPLASPLPLAFFVFGVGSALQSVLQLCLIPQGESSILVLIFGAFVFSPMVFASIIAFPTRETFDATLIGLLSFSWLLTALVQYSSPPPHTSSVLSVFSLMVALVLLLPAGPHRRIHVGPSRRHLS